MDERRASLRRKTSETSVEIDINLDGSGKYEVNTGIGFFDHMLSLFAKHGGFDLCLKAEGDIEVDPHHTVEDAGIVLGKCIKEALGDKRGIKRYGTFFVPMDETLAMVSVDISGRPYIVFDGAFTAERLGSFDTELVEEFFRALAFNGGITLHGKIMYGKNNHHMIEAMFKALGRALGEATFRDGKSSEIPSTKGML